MNKAENTGMRRNKFTKHQKKRIQRDFLSYTNELKKVLKKKLGNKNTDYFAIKYDYNVRDVIIPFINEYETLIGRKFTEKEKELISKAFDGILTVFHQTTISGMVLQLAAAKREIADSPELYPDISQNSPLHYSIIKQIKISEQEERLAKEKASDFHSQLFKDIETIIKAGAIPDEFWREQAEKQNINKPEYILNLVQERVKSMYIGDMEITKSAMHLEHQKLGVTYRNRQTSIFDILDNEKNLDSQKGELKKKITDYGITYQGINLTIAEDRVFRAIQKILSDSDYKGNTTPQIVKDPKKWGHNSIELPSIKFTLTELYEAAGVEKYKTERGWLEYSGKERQLIKDGLKSLAEKQHWIYYDRKYFDREKGEKLKDVVSTVAPVIDIKMGWEALREDDSPEVGTAKYIQITPSPIMIDQIESYFVLRPAKLHSEIRRKFKGGKGTETVTKLIDFLFIQVRESKFKEPLMITINYKNLGSRLKLDSYFSKQNWSGLRKALITAYDKAFQLGYLLEFKTDVTNKGGEPIDILILNRDKFILVKKESDRTETPAE